MNVIRLRVSSICIPYIKLDFFWYGSNFVLIFQYLYWKQMANAATVIQNKYRTYCENKRFKKSKDAAMCIQSYYRTYKENRTGRSSVRSSRESTPSTSAGVK
jgi:hypothetical protein